MRQTYEEVSDVLFFCKEKVRRFWTRNVMRRGALNKARY